MKNLFVIACGLSFITQSFGDIITKPRYPTGRNPLYSPYPTNNIYRSYHGSNISLVKENVSTAWGFSGYNTKEFITDKYSIKTDDKEDVKYVRINAAVNIYLNGATFCDIELQYSAKELWKPMIHESSCKTICKYGFSGDKCEEIIKTVTTCDDVDLTKKFYTNTLQIKPEEKNIDAFYVNGRDLILLQIVSTKEHSIEVQPIEFYCTNKCSVNTRGNSILLCALGYKKNDNSGECECETQNQY